MPAAKAMALHWKTLLTVWRSSTPTATTVVMSTDVNWPTKSFANVSISRPQFLSGHVSCCCDRSTMI